MPGGVQRAQSKNEAERNRAALLWQATLEYGPFAISAVLLLLSSLADVMPKLQNVFPPSQVGIYVCVTFVAVFAFLLRMSDRIESLSRAVRESGTAQQRVLAAATPSVMQVPLAQAFRLAESTVGKTDHIRIFAVTSRFISQHMQPREFSTSRLDLMVAAGDPGPGSMVGAEVRLSVLYTWAGRVRAGAIGRLIVRQYDFYPMEWFVIFDDRFMITSTYMYESATIGKARTVAEAFVVLPHAEGGSLIDAKIETFDALFAAAETDFGAGEYEGEYSLMEGAVKRKRDHESEWVALDALSQASIA